MFIGFFYKLREAGIPVSPTSFLTLQKALGKGLVSSLDDFYTASRAVLVKSERYFDLFDQVFAHHFEGAEMPDYEGVELDELARALLESWLHDPETLAAALGMDESQISKLSPLSAVRTPCLCPNARTSSFVRSAKGKIVLLRESCFTFHSMYD